MRCLESTSLTCIKLPSFSVEEETMARNGFHRFVGLLSLSMSLFCGSVAFGADIMQIHPGTVYQYMKDYPNGLGNGYKLVQAVIAGKETKPWMGGVGGPPNSSYFDIWSQGSVTIKIDNITF